MARSSDTVTYNPEVHKETVKRMEARREEVHARGRRVYEETGKLDPLVDVMKAFRVARNSMVKSKDGYVLKNGIALPILSASDGTGSMADNLKRTFFAMNALETLLDPVRAMGYNTQLASAVAQDVQDRHPVAQESQYETDNRREEQIRLLVPDADGGDPTEDYQFLMAYVMLANQTDLSDFYGLKGYFFLMADQICRERLTREDFLERTGHTLQSATMTTKVIAQALQEKWHFYYLQVGSGGEGGRRNDITRWWEERSMKSRILIVPDPDYLAEAEAALIYVSENLQPKREDFVKFLVEGTKSNKRRTAKEAEMVWEWLIESGIPFGAQAKLRTVLGCELPKPGDVFEHFRHAWPKDHPKASTNAIPTDDAKAPSTTGRKPKPGTIDWAKLK